MTNAPPKQFKFHDIIDGIAACPPEECTERKLSPVFRMVHNPLTHPHNFLPQKKTESREDWGGAAGECGYCSISMFTDEQKMRKRFRDLFRCYQLLRNKIGDHVAAGSIDPADGRSSEPSKRSSHFDFYEYFAANIQAKFKIVGAKI